MHRFQGCRASLESLCINFGGEQSTIATLMFAVLHVLLNDLVRYLIFHWVYTILFIQQFWNFHQIRMISTLVHSFKLNFHDFVHLMTTNLETNWMICTSNIIKFPLSLLNLVCSIFIWIFMILHTQRIRIFLKIRTICTSNVHYFSLSFHGFVHSTNSNF